MSWGGLALCIIFFPWGIYEAAQSLVGRVVMSVLAVAAYPEPSDIINARTKIFNKLIGSNLQTERVVRSVTLMKNGVKYSGIMCGTKETINNGNWFVASTGNGFAAHEYLYTTIVKDVVSLNSNFLCIDHPAFGFSQGAPTPQTFADAQDVALSFVENKMNAKKVVQYGFSLGGAAMSGAIMQHNYKKDVEYVSVRDKTFSRLSDVAGSLTLKIVKWLVLWTGYDMDSTRASKRLKQLKIRDIIVQNSENEERLFDGDRIIQHEASLANAHVDQENVEIVTNSLGHSCCNIGQLEACKTLFQPATSE